MTPADVGQLVALAAIWGASYLFIRVAGPAFGPLSLMDIRVWLAGAALVPVGLALRQLPDLKGRWRDYLFLGAVNAAIPFALVAISVGNLNASISAILNSTTPFCGAIAAAIWLQDRLTPVKIAGMMLGLAGVLALVGFSPLEMTPIRLASVGGSLIASMCYGAGGVIVRKRFTGTPPVALTIGQQFGAGAALLPLALLSPPVRMPTLTEASALLALALLSTSFAYLIYFRMIGRVGPARTLLAIFLVPFFSLLWGIVFLGEPVNAGIGLGLALIVAGMALATGLIGRPRKAAQAPA